MPTPDRYHPASAFVTQLDDIFGSGRELCQILEEVARLGVALLCQSLRGGVSESLGRERYAHGER
jgi:hypothetical protein